jgi:16S rRNA (uracil1498-N3)-methyltransferase
MHRFYIPPEHWRLDSLRLDPAQAHHCLDVVRVKPGERIVVFNGLGAEATAEITGIQKHEVSLKHLHHSVSPRLPCAITLGQAVPKGKQMDLIVQKATELGVAAIAPLLSERTVVQLDAAEAHSRREKWTLTAIEAAKQCGQNWLPEIHSPSRLKPFFEARHSFDLLLIASLQSDSIHLKSVLADYESAMRKKPSKVLILIGPEGDFTPAESALAKSSGCRPITLGPIILRTETAALYCLSVLSYELLVA